MKKLLVFLPFIINLFFYFIIFISGGIKEINIFGWIVLILLFSIGYLMNKNKLSGFILGIIVGISFIIYGFINDSLYRIFNESYLGLIVCIYYSILEFMIRRKIWK